MDRYVDDYKLDCEVLDTLAIKRAINSCEYGDRVVFKNRLYRSGTIYLKSNISLYFETGAYLKASDDYSDFSNGIKFNDKLDVNTFVNCDYDGLPKLFFIYGKDIENVSIEGLGIIDGNESIFYGECNEYFIEGAFYPRMPLMFIENCKNLSISGVTLTNSAFWTVHLVGCDGVNIDSVKILNNRRMLNADGIDPDHSKNIVINNCYIESADDCIAIKNTLKFVNYGDSYNIVVKNSVFKSSSAAVKIGTETCSDFYDIHFENIKILDSNRGISLQLRDSGNIKDVYFKDIEMETHMFYPKSFWGKGECISITAIRRNEDTIIGNISNLYFDNINANSEHGIFLYGDIRNIDFNSLNINLVNNTEYEKNLYDLRPNEDLKFINDNPKVIYSKYVKNIKFNGFKYNDLYELINEDNESDIVFN